MKRASLEGSTQGRQHMSSPSEKHNNLLTYPMGVSLRSQVYWAGQSTRSFEHVRIYLKKATTKKSGGQILDVSILSQKFFLRNNVRYVVVFFLFSGDVNCNKDQCDKCQVFIKNMKKNS